MLPDPQPDPALYAQEVDAVIDRSRDLFLRAQSLLFPLFEDGLFGSRDYAGWSARRLLIHCFSRPFSYLSLVMDGDLADKRIWGASLLGTLLLLVAPVFWVYGGDAFLYELFIEGAGLAPPNLSYLFMLLVLLLSAVSYANWYDFWRDERNPLSFRLLVALAYVGVAVSLLRWAFDEPIRAQLHRVLEDAGMMLAFCAIYIFFILPIITWFFVLGVDFLRMGVRFLGVVIIHPLNFHRTYDRDILRKLVLDPVPPHEGNRDSRVESRKVIPVAR